MGDPVEVGNPAGKDLPAPDRPVIAVAHTVDRDTDALLTGRGRYMRPVVLDRENLRPECLSNLPCVPGREELWVEIMNNPVVAGTDQTPEPLRRLLQVGERPGIPDVPDMG